MTYKKVVVLAFALGSQLPAFSQTEEAILDSLYIREIEGKRGSAKVLHAEPLYIDLIRDLGARKGEHEWNIGLGLTDKLDFDSYEALVEYEWAPADRIGLEVELPFSFYSHLGGPNKEPVPSNKLNGIKVAGQWSFFVSEKLASSMALGYIHELELSDFKNFGKPLITGNKYNPFLVMAKRWGLNFHSLVYTGPVIQHHFTSSQLHASFQINSSFHYMIPGTRNFIGVEINKEVIDQSFDLIFRPQMRLAITESTMVGIVAGIPVNRTNERISSFIRLIWEPGN